MKPRLGDRRTLAQQIADDIRGRIRSGELAPGERLQSARAMVASYEVSTQTVQAAMDLLRAESLIESVPGRATFVRADLDPASLPAERPEDLSPLSSGGEASASSDVRAELAALGEQVEAGAAAVAERLAGIEQRLSQLEDS